MIQQSLKPASIRALPRRRQSTDVSATLGQPWAASSTERNLWLAVGASLFLHAAVLSLHFKFPDASRPFQDKALDIILVNSKSARKPSNAQALAQANLDGGGNTEQERRATTPLPPSARQQSGAELEQAQRRVQELEAQQQQLVTKARSKASIAHKPDREAQPEPTPGISGRDLAQSALAMARLEAPAQEICRHADRRISLCPVCRRLANQG
jgi:protein TonB